MGKDRRTRLLLAAGLTPDTDLSTRAQAALATLLDQPDGHVEAVLAMWVLVDEARPPIHHRSVGPPPEGLRYPDPRPTVKRPGPPVS